LMDGLIQNWNGILIPIVLKEKRRPFFPNYIDNIIIANKESFPDDFIQKKIRPSNRSKSFIPEEYTKLQKNTGFYCELQSISSEDAMTWSVFGNLNHVPKNQRVNFVQELLKHIGITSYSDDFKIALWTRIIHVDTGETRHGPEVDFSIIGDDTVILGESKWGSKIDERQGKSKKKTQLQLRREFLEKYGDSLYPDKPNKSVLLVGNEKPSEEIEKFVSWNDLCFYLRHPLGNELKRYFVWKHSLSQEGTVTCPNCKSENTILRIIWGLPVIDLSKGKNPTMILGGCMVPENPPQWGCKKCGLRF